MIHRSRMISMLALLALALPAIGLEVGSPFGDHMVLQRDLPVAVWGTAEPGQRVQVAMSGPGSVLANAVADAEGNWRLDLPAMPASAEPRVMRVVVGGEVPLDKAAKGGAIDQVVFKDVLVGEVWHVSGQSNMQWSVSKAKDAATEIAAADHPTIRLMTVPRNPADTPQIDVEASWQVCSPATVGEFSAVGYFMGRMLRAELGVPVGLIDTAWGGAAAEAYVPMEALRDEPGVRPYLAELEGATAGDDMPQKVPAVLFNGMIHPLAPYTVRGVAWYQGESNVGRAAAYYTLMPRLITEWRDAWAAPDKGGERRAFPFLQVQLAGFRQPVDKPGDNGMASLRDAQRHAADTVESAWLATAVDVGEADDIHPKNKQEVGRRLALLALRHVYGREDVAAEGPAFEALEAVAGGVMVHFEHAEGLTTTDGKPPRHFAVTTAGSGEWRWADAVIEGDTVRLTPPPGMAGPYRVRYAWATNPMDGEHGINLVNGAGLPAYPFDSATAK